jgi:alpha-tubulin suppressor-like RCC1 family protein
MGSGVTSVATATDTINEFTCAVKDGGAWCWGLNYVGELGDGTLTERHTPVPVSGLSSGVVAVTAGAFHACALMDTGAMKCWGYNIFGQLGNGVELVSGTGCRCEMAPVDVVGISGATAIGAGNYDTCALLGTGGVKCWGGQQSFSGGVGKLGDGFVCKDANLACLTPVDVSGQTSGVSAISIGRFRSCDIQAGAARCWSSNSRGALGNNSLVDSSVPVPVSGLTAGVTSVAAAAGGHHTCAVKDGGAWCWGDNGGGQLGLGGTLGPDVCGFSQCSKVPVAVPGLSTGVTAISTGGAYTCAIKSGDVYCWGVNGDGELGHPTVTPYTAGLVAWPALADTDADGCADLVELNLVPPTDPADGWDFYSVPVPALINAATPTTVFHDKVVSAADAQAVFVYFKVLAKTGSTAYEQDLNQNGIKDGVEYDRTSIGSGKSGPPDGVVSAQDAQLAFAQFKLNYSC